MIVNNFHAIEEYILRKHICNKYNGAFTNFKGFAPSQSSDYGLSNLVNDQIAIGFYLFGVALVLDQGIISTSTIYVTHLTQHY